MSRYLPFRGQPVINNKFGLHTIGPWMSVACPQFTICFLLGYQMLAYIICTALQQAPSSSCRVLNPTGRLSRMRQKVHSGIVRVFPFSIVAHACSNAINDPVFYATPSSGYLSCTPSPMSTSSIFTIRRRISSRPLSLSLPFTFPPLHLPPSSQRLLTGG